ncbi:hypothetical protein BJ944DRAFT_280544, partial [Cunninghamella echinulata]
MADQDTKMKELTARIEQNKKMRDKAIQILPLLKDKNAISQCETEIKEYQKYIDYFSEEIHKLQQRSLHRQSSDDGSTIILTPTSGTSATTIEPGTPIQRHDSSLSTTSTLPPRSSSIQQTNPSPSKEAGPRKKYTNLDLLTTATPYNKPKVSLKLHELEYKLDVEKQMLTAIKHMADLFERDPSTENRKRKSEVQGQMYESIEKLNLLKKALRKYKSLYIDEGDEDDDELETPSSARLPPGLRRPITGKLQMEIVEARELAHAPTRMIKSPSTVVVVKIDNNVVFSSRPSRSDRWFEQCEINVNKASEIEIALYDQSYDTTVNTTAGSSGVRLPIGVFWLKITDIAESLRRRKVLQETGAGWVSAQVAHEHSAGSGSDAGDAAVTLNTPLDIQQQKSNLYNNENVPPSLQAPNNKTEGIEAWFDIEPLGKIALRLNFVREQTAGGRPLDRLGRVGAVRQRKEEVHEINGHQFVEKKFYNIMKCALCSDFLVKLGYQCEDCEYTCHSDCYGKVVTKCISKSAHDKDSDEDKLNHRIPHRFEPITNIGGNWCCHCGYMLPLGSRNARKCSECGITCHAKCAHLVPDFCGMSMKMANQMLAEIKAAKKKTSDSPSIKHSKPTKAEQSPSSDLSTSFSQISVQGSPQPLPPKTPPSLHQPVPPMTTTSPSGSPKLSPTPQQQQQQQFPPPQHQQQQPPSQLPPHQPHQQHMPPPHQQQQRPMMHGQGPPPMIPQHGQQPQPGYPFPQPHHHGYPPQQRPPPQQYDPRYSPQQQQ